MRSPAAPLRTLARLVCVATGVAVAVSVWLLLTPQGRTYGSAALIVSICFVVLFLILELVYSRYLGWFQALASLARLRQPVETGLQLLLDPETTLPRPWVFSVRMTEEIQRAMRNGQEVALCLLEPDDRALLLDESFRGEVGRAVGGGVRRGEFATVDSGGRLLILLPGTAGPAAEEAARRFAKMLNSRLFEGKPCRWKGAFAYYPRDGTTAEDLLETAHTLLNERAA
jgi:GGDEF domain-containing protein